MKLNTFDILPCAGNGKFSKIIQRANKLMGYTGVDASISHVAMVLRNNDKPIAYKRRAACIIEHGLNVFESTTLNWNGKKGVQINPYDEWLKNYDGEVYVRRLHCERPEGVAEWTASQVGRPYENGLGGLLELLTVYTPHQWLNKTKWGRWLRGKLKTPSPHCSEIDAECLQKFGLMYDVRTNKLPPAMWFGSRLDKIMKCEVDKPEKLK